MLKQIYFITLLSTLTYAQSLEGLFKILEKKNLILKNRSDTTLIKNQEIDLASKWDNPILGVGANDFLLDNFDKRDLEPMQTHFITLSQKIPTNGKLSIKENISKTQKEISDYLYKDTLLKQKSTLIKYVYTYSIIKEKLKLLNRYINNVKKIKKLHSSHLSIGKMTQQSIEKSNILEKKLFIKRRKLMLLKKTTIFKIQKLLFRKISTIKTSLKMNKKITQNIANHPLLKAYKKKITNSNQNLILKRADKTPDIKLQVGYFQRESRSDYLSFNLAMPLPIRGSEENKIAIATLKQAQAIRELKTLKNNFKQELSIYNSIMKEAKSNFLVIKTELIPSQNFLIKLINQEQFTKDASSTNLLKSINALIMLELEALDEKKIYFNAYSKLYYLQGETR